MIKNLSQFKKAINEKRAYVIIEHFVKPEFAGQVRVPTKVQTNAYYSKAPKEPESEVNTANGGLGYWNEYGKASDWEFREDGTIVQYHTWTPYNREPERRLIQEIRFIEE